MKVDLQKFIDKAAEISRQTITKTSDAVTRFGDESVVRIEKLQMENQIKQEIAALGQKVFDTFEQGHDQTLSLENKEIKEIFDKIVYLKNEVADRAESLKK